VGAPNPSSPNEYPTPDAPCIDIMRLIYTASPSIADWCLSIAFCPAGRTDAVLHLPRRRAQSALELCLDIVCETIRFP
jgi:hypothetical protein